MQEYNLEIELNYSRMYLSFIVENVYNLHFKEIIYWNW